MIAATYCGLVEVLRGRRAILQPAEGQFRVLAQFDDVHLGPAYALGWREFGVHEFNLVLADQVALARQRRQLLAAASIPRPLHLAEPTDPDYEAKTADLVAAAKGLGLRSRLGDAA